MSEYTPRPRVYLSRPVSGPPIARLSFYELVHLLTLVNTAALHLLVECNAMKTHVRAGRLCHGAVVFMRLRDDTFTIPKSVTHSVGHSAVFSEVSDYSAVLAPTVPLSCDFGLLFHRERL